MDYTVGYIFSSDRKKVLLMHKTGPAWQAGRMNGAGGKMEAGETPVDCFVREVEEETALRLFSDSVIHVGYKTGIDWTVHVMTCLYPGLLSDAMSITDERIEWVSVREYPDTVLEHIPLDVEMCLYRLDRQDLESIVISYHNKDRDWV